MGPPTILYYTMLYYTILNYTILYYTKLYYTKLYYTIFYHFCFAALEVGRSLIICAVYLLLYYTVLKKLYRGCLETIKAGQSFLSLVRLGGSILGGSWLS